MHILAGVPDGWRLVLTRISIASLVGGNHKCEWHLNAEQMKSSNIHYNTNLRKYIEIFKIIRFQNVYTYKYIQYAFQNSSVCYFGRKRFHVKHWKKYKSDQLQEFLSYFCFFILIF